MTNSISSFPFFPLSHAHAETSIFNIGKTSLWFYEFVYAIGRSCVQNELEIISYTSPSLSINFDVIFGNRLTILFQCFSFSILLSTAVILAAPLSYDAYLMEKTLFHNSFSLALAVTRSHCIDQEKFNSLWFICLSISLSAHKPTHPLNNIHYDKSSVLSLRTASNHY